MPFDNLPDLPPQIELDSAGILKAAIQANRYLAELKGYCQTLPNPNLLLNTVILQESRDSSAIENIVTTQDELYQAILNPTENLPSTVKEVISYKEAVYVGIRELERINAFTSNLAVKIMQRVKNTTARYRTMPGIKLHSPHSKKTIYTPPSYNHIEEKMMKWEKFLNEASDTDPLILLALMHYQFEAIHPFADGNGRTGRILNVLFLVHKDLLNLPVLYHSAYIIQHKEAYYRKLRLVTEECDWEGWIIFMLDAIKETAMETLGLIKKIIKLKDETLENLKSISQKIPAYELNELIFSYPYVKIKLLEEKKIAKRQAASTYLQELANRSILSSFKVGREVYYVNDGLMGILSNK